MTISTIFYQLQRQLQVASQECGNSSSGSENCTQLLNELRQQVESLQAAEPNITAVAAMLEEVNRLQVGYSGPNLGSPRCSH